MLLALFLQLRGPAGLHHLPQGTEVRFKPILVGFYGLLLFAPSSELKEFGLYSEGYREPLKIFEQLSDISSVF